MDNQQNNNQQFNNTIDLQTGNTDPIYLLERTEEYWNDLMVDALGPNAHDGMPSNIEGDFDNQHTELAL